MGIRAADQTTDAGCELVFFKHGAAPASARERDMNAQCVCLQVTHSATEEIFTWHTTIETILFLLEAIKCTRGMSKIHKAQFNTGFLVKGDETRAR